MSENITRPIIGIENRTPQEVFDIMVARIGASPAPLPNVVGDKPSIASLDERMIAAGMIPLSDLLSGETPLKRWMAHTGVSDLLTFQDWLSRRYEEFMRMKVAYELGDKPKDDELYEWVLSHCGALGEVVANFRQMKERMADAASAAAPVPTAEFTSHMESYRVFVAEVAPRLHWKVWAAVGNSGLYEGGFDGWRHGFGMTQLEAAPLPELMDNMRSALRAALSSPMEGGE